MAPKRPPNRRQANNVRLSAAMASKKQFANSTTQVPRDIPAWFAFIVLAVAICLVYGSTIDAPFIFDDLISIEQNPSIVRLWPLWGDVEHPGPLRPPVENPMSARPLVNLSLALNYYVGELNPRGYHLVNMALHLASALLLWAVVRRTLLQPYFAGRFTTAASKLALLVALVWALHPLVTEAVAYVTQRTELMVVLFYLATLYASLRYWAAESPAAKRSWWFAAVLAAFCGAASKEVMVAAPVVVFLYEGTFLRSSWRDVLRSSWPLYLGLANSWLLIALLQWGTPRGQSAGFGLGLPILDWWSTQAEVFAMYMKLAVYPWPLTVHYEMPVQPLGVNWPYVLAAVATIAATLFLLWRRLAAGFLLAVVLLVLAPTHLVPIPTEMAAERRMYLPLAALIALVIVGLYHLISQTANRKPLTVLAASAAVVLMLFYALASHNRLALYIEPLKLWQDAVANQPANAMMQLNLGVALTEQKRYEEAVEHFQHSIRLDPNNDKAHYGLGLSYAHLGETDKAVKHLREVVRLKPQAYRLRNNLGVVLFSAGRYPEAIVEFEKTLQIQPDFTEARDNLNRARQASVLPQGTQ
jgi:tetratricopeptide (TPR) repeat protein